MIKGKQAPFNLAVWKFGGQWELCSQLLRFPYM